MSRRPPPPHRTGPAPGELQERVGAANRSGWWLAAGLIGLALTLTACGDRAACPIQCGGVCVIANVCESLSCPASSPCDPCSGQCRPQCGAEQACGDPSQTCCSGVCSDVASDLANCGACGRHCGADTDRCGPNGCACGDGPACGAGMLCCGGVCIGADASNCGACGLSCSGGETCDLNARACRCGAISVPGARACAVNQACCGGACLDIKSNPDHCGACELSCGGGVKCLDGRCDCSMAGCQNSSQSCCAGGCVNVATDTKDCGACGVSCGTSETCVAAKCTCSTTTHAGGPACVPGQTCCPGGCFTLSSSSSNCGACGRVCDGSTTLGCAQGACTCRPGFSPVAGDPSRCVDINECLSGIGGCPAGSICQNSAGSYSCPCDTGHVPYAGGCTPVPVVILSSSFGGGALTEISASQTLYGRMLYLGATNAQSCVETLPSGNGYCGTLGNWTTLPNADWSFDSGSSEWRATFPGGSFPAGMYRLFLRNSSTGVAMAPWVLTLR